MIKTLMHDNDTFNDYGLTSAEMKYANAYDINIHGQIR